MEGGVDMRTWKAKEAQLTEWLTKTGLWVAQLRSRYLRGEAVEDIEWGECSVELKTRKAFPPQYLVKWLAQAETNKGWRTPVLVIHKDGTRMGKQLVVLSLADFVKLLEGRANVDSDA